MGTPWVKIKLSQEDNWMHIRAGEMEFQLSRPVSYVLNPAVESAVHRSVFTNAVDVAGGGAVLVAQHIVEYNPDFPVFGVSIVHELAHAKTDELGYFCFPPLTGETSEEHYRSWGWIDEYYAHRVLARYSEPLFLFELALKVGLLAQLDPAQPKDLHSLIKALSALALYEALAPRVDSVEVVGKIKEIAGVWSPVFKIAPHLWEHKELLRTVLSRLPELEKLTKEQYIDNGLEILYSKHITKPKTTISRGDYRRQVFRVVKRIKAAPRWFSSPYVFL